MSARSRKTKLPRLLAALAFLPLAALAAPHADPKLVDSWSRMDEFHAFRGVPKAAVARELKRDAKEEAPFAALLDAFMEENQNTGLLVLRDDTILGERYGYGRTAEHRLASASIAKTVLAMLVGIALQEKIISSLDDRAARYIPELRNHAYGDTSLLHLITMSSGMKFNERKLIANAIRRQTEGGVETVREFDTREAPGGLLFNYSSPDSQVLSLALRRALKKPLADYLAEKIWQPMGAEGNATWIVDKAGFEAGFCCLNARLRDYARFGMLLANYGRLDGKQIIPEAWVRAATRPSAPHLEIGAATGNNGYGYQVWILGNKNKSPAMSSSPPSASVGGGGPFAALGFHGQAIFVDPVSKVVVVHTAVWTDGNDRRARGRQFKFFEEVLSKVQST